MEARFMSKDGFDDRYKDLTDVEVTEMMDMIEEGIDDRTIAEQFDIDPETVRRLKKDLEKDI
jgi:DNA-binding CsgD family transcriptional regulator